MKNQNQAVILQIEARATESGSRITLHRWKGERRFKPVSFDSSFRHDSLEIDSIESILEENGIEATIKSRLNGWYFGTQH